MVRMLKTGFPISTDNPIKYNPERVLTQAQKDINDDHHYWDWFDAWWAQDFSWDGLAKRKIEGWDDGRTLQDYWREEEGDLIDFAGRTWTRFHLPPHDRSGEEKSEKYEFTHHAEEDEKRDTWYEAILEKLGEATIWYFMDPDTRAQFTGVCFPAHFTISGSQPVEGDEEQNEKLILHIIADWAMFGRKADFSNALFGNRVGFNSTLFGHSAYFHKAQFGDQADFRMALFGVGADFIGAQFGNNATFNKARFNDKASFNSAFFGHEAWFEDVEFGNHSSFVDTTFINRVSFCQSIFYGICYFSALSDMPKNYGDSCEHDFRLAVFQNDIDFF